MNHHEKGRVRLLQYIYGELKGTELAGLRGHLESCRQCREEAEEEMALSGALRRSRPLYVIPFDVRVAVEELMAVEPRLRGRMRRAVRMTSSGVGHEANKFQRRTTQG
jgi:hypothetical protein